MVAAYSRPDIQRQVCDAVAAGWTLAGLEGRPGWPSRQTLYRWTLADPAFAARLKEARGRRRGERVSAGPVFDAGLAQAFLVEVRRGEPVRHLVRRPGWPNRERLNRWKRERPDFEAELAEAARFARQARPKRWARYDEAVADAVILRLKDGEPVTSLWSDPGLPGKAALGRWRRRRPDFDHAVRTAELAGHRARMAGRRRLTAKLSDEILARLAEGRSLRQVSFLAGMPHVVTMYGWMRRDAEFARMVRWAREEGRIARALAQGCGLIAAADRLAGG